jgi:hypothetical protein
VRRLVADSPRRRGTPQPSPTGHLVRGSLEAMLAPPCPTCGTPVPKANDGWCGKCAGGSSSPAAPPVVESTGDQLEGFAARWDSRTEHVAAMRTARRPAIPRVR